MILFFFTSTGDANRVSVQDKKWGFKKSSACFWEKIFEKHEFVDRSNTLSGMIDRVCCTVCINHPFYSIDFTDARTREQRDSDARRRRWSGTTKCSKIISGSRGGGRALFVALIDVILRGRTALFQAATQPPERPSIPKYPGWLVRRASNIFLCCRWVSLPMIQDFWQRIVIALRLIFLALIVSLLSLRRTYSCTGYRISIVLFL